MKSYWLLCFKSLPLTTNNKTNLLKIVLFETVYFTQIFSNILLSVCLSHPYLHFMSAQIKLDHKLYRLCLFLPLQKFRRLNVLLPQFIVVLTCWLVLPALFLHTTPLHSHFHSIHGFLKTIDRLPSFVPAH